MAQRTLIAYATKCGSTAEIAEAIGDELQERGVAVDVKPAGQVTNLDGYDRAVIGSAVRAGRWLGEASDFVKRHQERLAAMPSAIFSVHMGNRDDDEASVEARRAYAAPAREALKPEHEAFFGGVMDYSCLSLIPRLLVKAMGSKEEDLRDWDAIKAWAAEIA